MVILRGAGKAFCAGHDLREMQAARTGVDLGRGNFTALFQDYSALMQATTALSQPVIAAVQGLAAAAGCQLAASCDLIVAADIARFGVNGVDIGLLCSTPMVALLRKVRPAVAFEMRATGEFISAARVHEVGLVIRLAMPNALMDLAIALAATLAAKLPVAIQPGKATFHAH